MTGCEGRAKQCIHQRHCCCPSSSYCSSPFTSMHVFCSAALCDQGKRALAMQIIPHHHLRLPQEFLTLLMLRSDAVPYPQCVVKQRRSWITILFVFHFKYLFSRPQSSVKHLYSRSGGKCGKVSDRAGPAWHWQSQPLFEFWVLGLPSLLVYLPSFSSVSLHFLLPLLAFSFNRLQS